MAITRTSPAGNNRVLCRFPGVSRIREAVGRSGEGFTLIELMVVIAIISILFLITVPRLSRLINRERNSFAILTGMIAKTFDDSFLRSRTNYLVVHMAAPNPEEPELCREIGNRRNGLSVITKENDVYVESKRTTLKGREFSQDNFLFTEVIRPNGTKISSGSHMIPFYPQGYSDNCIIHVLVNGDQQWSVKINKHFKEPKVISGYITYEEKTD